LAVSSLSCVVPLFWRTPPVTLGSLGFQSAVVHDRGHLQKTHPGGILESFFEGNFPAAGKCSDAFSPDQECLIRWYKIDFSCQLTTLFMEIVSRPKRFNSARTNRIASVKESFQSCNSNLQDVVTAAT
jgi:hypothetical protein